MVQSGHAAGRRSYASMKGGAYARRDSCINPRGNTSPLPPQ
jgi:hypothetical protein